MRPQLLLLPLVLCLLTTGGLDQRQVGPGEPAGDILRLHILAHSDAPEDQELKLLVRDAVLSVLTPQLQGAASVEEASRGISKGLDQLALAVREELRARGQEHPVALRLCRTHFPSRSYGGTLFPAGEYQALQIVIGAGLGANWWCVLFPPLCLVDGTTAKAAEEDITAEVEEPDSPNPEIRFKLVEWFQQLRT
ncbi:MAG: stage II sporulation protein R [Firmicutes bacterium]|nr:stage II sporulation protein R [Bacillota bacterium]